MAIFSTIGTVGFLINSTINISKRLLEIRDVERQAQDVLEVSDGIKKILQQTRRLRRQKWQLLSNIEKGIIDAELEQAERAVRNVAMLVEPARADMQTNSGSVTLATRGWFVVRDSPKIVASLERLRLAYQGLNTAITVLCSRGPGPEYMRHEAQPEPKYPPPSYEDSQFLNSKRHSIIFRDDGVELSGEWVDKGRGTHEDEPIIEVSPAVLQPGPDMSGLQVDWREQPRWQAAFDRIRPPEREESGGRRAQTPDPNSMAGGMRVEGRSRGQRWLAHRASYQEGMF
ncbi:hypothetical protein B0J12DRAFT_693367 [Macrophomina phaseolina]|uniref:Fungal N-terminal domain-containing protein n=1 Tax=Macrophomina phaseolina TaxID=35725 RepID=A0ABQ8GUN8_9PEZI|nr:hypothetical protein B0J12DRAFT_693367 [Macrophomina phaseolina]